MAGLRGRVRRLGLGLQTLLGRPRGFFIPYRYAGAAKPGGYPALAPLFEAAEPAMADLLAATGLHAAEFGRIGAGDDGPARFDQDWFPRLDACAAYGVVRRERPRRIVEIGSGHSTRFMLRAIADGELGTDLVAIDPAPRARLPDGPALRHVPALFGAGAGEDEIAALGAGDILFVDSSHVAMPGTDLDRLVGAVLPRLVAGTWLHLHDIVLPDRYPTEWAWRGYNEATVVAALLAGGGWEIAWSSHWIASRRPDLVAGSEWLRTLPLRPGARETSLWLRRR